MSDQVSSGSAAPAASSQAAPAQASSQTNPSNPAPVDNTGEVSEDELAELEAIDLKDVSKEEAKEIKKAIRSLEVKVNGKSKTVDIDMNDEESIRSYVQKAMAAEEKFLEGKQYKSQADQLVKMLQEDPLSVLRNKALGHDVRKLAEQILLEDLEEESKSPEQKKMEEYERKLKSYEENEKKKDEESKKARLEEATRRNYEDVQGKMIQALETSSFPAEPYFVRRVSDIWASVIESGWEDASIEDIMPYVESKLKNDFGSLLDKHSDPEKLEKLLGKDRLDKYRKYKISKVRKAPTTATTASTTVAKASAPEVKTQAKKIKIEDIGGW